MSPPDVSPLDVSPAPAKPVPTQDQRFAIRSKIEATFDDKTGRYLEGYSDQRIGEELGLPWIIVREIREAAYGPIRSDPEIDALSRDGAALVEQAATLMRRAGELKDQALDLQRRVAACAQRLGIAAA